MIHSKDVRAVVVSIGKGHILIRCGNRLPVFRARYRISRWLRTDKILIEQQIS
jgi:hypothetical protein